MGLKGGMDSRLDGGGGGGNDDATGGSRSGDEDSLEEMIILLSVVGTIVALCLITVLVLCVCKVCFGRTCVIKWLTTSSSPLRPSTSTSSSSANDGYEADSALDNVIIFDSQPKWKASGSVELPLYGVNGGYMASPYDSTYTNTQVGVSGDERIKPSRSTSDHADEYLYTYDGRLRSPAGKSQVPTYGESSLAFRADQELQELCRTGMTDSETVMVGSKLVVFISREVSHLGDTLVLSDMGISLTVPPYAIEAGRTELISLILDWDLGDFPEMGREESIISPVVHCGPHGLTLKKPAVLSYKHCAYDTKDVSLVASETHLMQTKDWKKVCGRDDRAKPYTLLLNEIQVQLTHFTLYTCLAEGKATTKKWMQLAVFGGRMRPKHRYEIRLYFLNNTPCALQFAIQNEAKSHFKQLCPRKEFLFHGGGEDILASVLHVNEGWSHRLDDRQEQVPFLSLWHGKCPSVSFIFKHEDERVRDIDVRLEVSQLAKDKVNTNKTNLKVLASMRSSSMSKHKNDNASATNRAVINVFPPGRRGKRRRCGSESSGSFSSDSVRSSSSQSSRASFSSSSLTSSSSSTSNASSDTNTDNESVAEQTDRPSQQPCTQNMQIHIHPTSTSIPNVCTQRTIPHELCMELVALLDPLCPLGNDWRVLASALEMDSLIPLLKNTPVYNPTETLLDEAERQAKSLEWLASVMMNSKRLDVANTVMKYANNSEKSSPENQNVN